MNKRKHDAPQPTAAAKMRKTDDPDGDLPNEIYLHIMSFLPARDLGATCTLVSRGWNELSRTRSLWKRILIQRHPEWYGDLSHMNVNFVFMSPRERIRLLEDRHDPAERRADCCLHDVCRGARCRCCTCRRYRNTRERDRDESVRVGLRDWDSIMTMTYDANAATVESIREAHPYERPDWLDVLREKAMLRTWRSGEGPERVAWTEKAHRLLRPPLASGLGTLADWKLVEYTDAEMIVEQPDALSDFSDISTEQDRGVLCWCCDPIDIAELHTIAAKAQPHLASLAEFERVVLSLMRAGWLSWESPHRVEWSMSAEQRFTWPAQEIGDGHHTVLVPM